MCFCKARHDKPAKLIAFTELLIFVHNFAVLHKELQKCTLELDLTAKPKEFNILTDK